MLYGIDIGGTKIAFCVLDQDLNCLFEKRIPTPYDYETFLSSIIAIVQQADTKFNCKGKVGIGYPGAFNIEDNTVNCANVPALNRQPLFDDLCSLLDREIKFENDANCFLLSECFGGSAEGCKMVLGVTIGTGLGGAIFHNGELLKGQNDFAGEIGHYPLPATVLKKYSNLPDLTCGCGRQMCLETYASGTGLGNLYKHYTNSPLKGPAILAQYHEGNVVAKKVLDIYFDILAAGIATAMLVLDADAIVFGGGLSKFEILVEEFSKRLPEHLLTSVALPRVVNAKFGDEGGVRGAALLNYVKQ